MRVSTVINFHSDRGATFRLGGRGGGEGLISDSILGAEDSFTY